MLNFRFAKDHLLHRLRGKTRHGTHSPFVYRLLDEVIYDNCAKKVYDEVESICKSSLSDERVTPQGTLKSPKLDQLLYRLVADLQPGKIIQLGTCPRITALYLKKAAPDAKFYTMESYPETEHPDKLDFAFIGGNHQKEDTLKYFKWCLPKVQENTLLIFDDIHRSGGMKEAWNEIKAHPKVTVTIDLFWIGLVYFKKGQAREDFVIKF